MKLLQVLSTDKVSNGGCKICLGPRSVIKVFECEEPTHLSDALVVKAIIVNMICLPCTSLEKLLTDENEKTGDR